MQGVHDAVVHGAVPCRHVAQRASVSVVQCIESHRAMQCASEQQSAARGSAALQRSTKVQVPAGSHCVAGFAPPVRVASETQTDPPVLQPAAPPVPVTVMAPEFKSGSLPGRPRRGSRVAITVQHVQCQTETERFDKVAPAPARTPHLRFLDAVRVRRDAC